MAKIKRKYISVSSAEKRAKKMKKMKYKNYTFPYNPKTTSMKCDRRYIKHKYPRLSGQELEDFGLDAMVITGKITFFSKQKSNGTVLDAYNEYKKLYQVYKKKGVGTVSHPVFTQIKRGLMVNLECEVDAEVNCVHVTFEIVADTKPNVKENLKKYAVKEVKPSTDYDGGSGGGGGGYDGGGGGGGSKTYNVGDIVNFHGGTHYVSSYSSASGYSARAGQAKITLGPDCKGNGGAHPWHLIHTDSSSNVYGWVDEGTFD